MRSTLGNVAAIALLVFVVVLVAMLQHERYFCADSGRGAGMAWDWGPVYGCRLEIRPGEWQRLQRDLL